MHVSKEQASTTYQPAVLQPWHFLCLLLATVSTAFLLVWSTHDGRQLNRISHDMRGQIAKERLMWRQLSLEYNTLLNHARIESLSKKELAMRPAHLGDSKLIDLKMASSAPEL